jgi:hypothetical protein
MLRRPLELAARGAQPHHARGQDWRQLRGCGSERGDEGRAGELSGGGESGAHHGEGDAREELSFKVRFGAVVHADDHDRTHVQSFEVRRAFGPTASSGASRPARRSTYWPRVGQEKQRRSRPDPEARPRQYEAMEAAPASTRGCLYRGGQRFESPQLHQEVGGNDRGCSGPECLHPRRQTKVL